MELRDLKNIETLTYGWRADASDISRFYPGAPPPPIPNLAAVKFVGGAYGYRQ